MPKASIGIIGGSGLYDIEGLTEKQEISVDTPFGKPSDSILVGSLEGVDVAFLPRHGRGHRIPPTDLPSRANIYALKSLGVTRIIAVNAVGSLKEEVKPGDLLVPDQLIDRTRSRVSTFFSEDIEADFQLLVDAGATAVSEPAEASPGSVLAMLRDPWGVVVQLASRTDPMI